MKVFYSASQVNVAAPVIYQSGRVKFCCVEMNRWWGRLIGFGARDCPESTSREVSLFLSRLQTNGKATLEVVPVQCCPWCGEAIGVCRSK